MAKQDELLDSTELAQKIRHLTAESGSLAGFGETFIRNALREAATVLESGSKKTNSVDFNVKVNVKFAYGARAPGKPNIDPGSIDLCYEVCASGERSGSFLGCYGSCRAPGLPVDPIVFDPLQRTCNELWEEFLQGNRTALIRLLNAGCLTHAQTIRALEPLIHRSQ